MAVFDCFLKIEGVEGESHDAKHKGEIDVVAFSWGASQSGSFSHGGGGGVGKVMLQDLSFTAKVNKASTKLMLACASGEHFKKAVLICRKAGTDQQEFMKYTMSDLLISSYSIYPGSDDELPLDSVSINFAKVEFEYKEQKVDGTLGGTIKSGWDNKANKPI